MTGSGTEPRIRTPGLRTWTRLAYLALLFLVLLAPFTFRLEAGYLLGRVGELLAPAALSTGDMVDAARNVLLLAGWGLLEVVTDDGRPRGRRVAAALTGGAAIGLTAELLQLGLPRRIPSLLDVATNAAGAGLGALGADLFERVAGRGDGERAGREIPAAALALPYALAILLEATFPLSREAARISSGGPLARAAWAMENFSWESAAVLPVFEFVLFLPAGFLLFAALHRAGARRGRALALAAGSGAALAVVGQLARAPLGEAVQLGPVLVHGLAVLLGAGIGAWWLRGVGSELGSSDEQSAATTATALYVGLLALWRLRPFVPDLDPAAITAELSLSRWSPVAALMSRGDLYVAADVLRSFALFLPLGILAGVADDRRAPSQASVGPDGIGAVVAVVLLLELGQAVVGERYFDGTDLVVTAAGGVLGWWWVRRGNDRASGAPG